MTSINALALKPYGLSGGVSRVFVDRLVDSSISVKDFGAVGDGSTNDRDAIQAALDAAVGPWTAPNVFNGLHSYSVYFPPGLYSVAPAVGPFTITNVTAGPGNLTRITVASTTGLTNGDMGYVRGVAGVPNANGSWSIANLTGTTFDLQGHAGDTPQFSGSYTGGGTFCPPALRTKAINGPTIFGAGLFATRIHNTVANSATWSTNGCYFVTFRDMFFSASNGGIAFDLNWDGIVNQSAQSNAFMNCGFGSDGTTTPDYGCVSGMAQQMCSETTFFNCFTRTGSVAGMSWHNGNALSGTVVGGTVVGNGSTSGSGILVSSGACQTILGVHFLGNTQSIKVANAQSDGYYIGGCYTEDAKFVNGAADLGGYSLDAIEHKSGTVGALWDGEGGASIKGAISQSGDIRSSYISVQNTDFGNSNYLFPAAGENPRDMSILPPPRTQQTGTYTMQPRDTSSKVVFNTSSAMNATMGAAAGGYGWQPGNWIDVQQIGTGQVTFVGATSPAVTIHGAKGLKLRTQNSKGRLFCNSSDVWTLSGDCTT